MRRRDGKRIRRALTLAALLLAASLRAQSLPPRDSGQVYAGVTDYFEQALSGLTVPEICRKIDLLIASAEDERQQAQLAGLAFDYYRDAPLMGQEAVAVYVADHYFLNKRLPWSDPDTYPLLYAYAEFNRASLLGCDAPELRMENRAGETESLRGDGGHYKLLYFYDPQCATCRTYSEAVAELARTYSGGRLSVFTVNTGADRERWEGYLDEHFSDITAWKVDMHHLWDPEDTNDYRRAYGVLSTPALLLIDAQNKIIGRRLDPSAARELLGHYNFADRRTRKLVREICEALGPVDTATADQIGRTLYERMGADSALYRETVYELFNDLRDRPDHASQQGAALIGERYILGRPDYFSPEYRGLIRHALEVFRLNPVGSKAPELLLQDTAGRNVPMLGRRAKRTLVIFHIVNCPDCRREFERLSARADEYARKGLRVVCVYAGRDEAAWREFVRTHDPRWVYLSDLENRSEMRERYDVAFVPKLYLLDCRRRIIAKEIDALTLEQLVLSGK